MSFEIKLGDEETTPDEVIVDGINGSRLHIKDFPLAANLSIEVSNDGDFLTVDLDEDSLLKIISLIEEKLNTGTIHVRDYY